MNRLLILICVAGVLCAVAWMAFLNDGPRAGKIGGSDAKERVIRRDWQQSFGSVFSPHNERGDFTRIIIEHDGAGGSVEACALKDGVALGDAKRVALQSGLNEWPVRMPKDGKYSVEFFSDEGVLAVNLEPDAKDPSLLFGRAGAWTAGRRISGRIVGEKGRYWVHVVTKDDDPASGQLRSTAANEDGTFEIKNVPSRAGLFVAVQFGHEPMLIGQANPEFTIPVRENLGDLVVRRQ